jgi:hypothetical protein
MSKFTNGDWEVKQNGFWDISVISNGGTVCHVSNKGDWFPKGEGTIGRSFNRMLADASLISAAPYLFDALQEIVKASDGMEIEGIDIEKACAALTKARGES